MMKRLTERLTHRQVVARGNLAVCYRARETALDRPVFVKALHPEISADADLRARFVREARALARLDHPHVVRLYEFGEDAELGPYMMLEYVEGTTLAERLRSGPRLMSEDIRRLAEQLFAGLSALHEAGIVHRDIKPGNILLRTDGVYKITDFSLAALRDEPKLTHHRAIMGTPAYMSPEQAAGHSPDEKSDLFAAGVVLYETATGANPFAGDDMLETMRRVRQMEPSFETPEMQALPDDLRELIRVCLQKERSHRPPSAEEALQRIRPAAIGSRISGKRKQSRTALVWIFIALIVGIAVIAFWVQEKSSRPLESKTAVIPQENDQAAILTDTRAMLESHGASAESLRHEPAAAVVGSLPQRKETIAQEASPEILVHEMGTISIPDPESTDVYLDIFPWAHVYHDGRRLGTTPMRQPLHLPAGEQTLSFRNPAFPELVVKRRLKVGTDSLKLNLADSVVMLDISVEPWGNIFIDGESVGSSPLGRPLFFRPGAHTLRVTHPNLTTVEKIFEAAAGDTILASVNLDRSELALRHRRDAVP